MAAPPKKFPGFGLPVDYGNDSPVRLPTALDGGWSSAGVTLREKRMMDFIDKITDKPGWDTKIFDDEIVKKWFSEAHELPATSDGDLWHYSQEMWDFCIAELKDKSTRFKETGQVNIFDAEVTIVKSDSAVSNELREELRAAVKALEDVPDRQKDWHPGSDGMVLDLVHPSLFPVVWGLTRALEQGTVPLEDCAKYIGKGKTVDSYEANSAEPQWGSYQWLPAEVSYREGVAKITSYINNLHPTQHKSLYGVLERITAATIPLWEESFKGDPTHRRIVVTGTGQDDWTYPAGLMYQVPNVPGPRGLIDPTTREPEGGFLEDEDDEWQYEDHFEDWNRQHRILVYPEPREYIKQAELAAQVDKEAVKLESSEHGLQVIYKLANIHLTPESPAYSGGTWHVEGTNNESIVASAIYYYDQDNITESHLAFRQAIDHEELMMIPEQNQHESLEAYLGIENEGPAVQTLGQVLTREGRLLAFPNVLQHQVQPFELQDATRPGHRKILAMFLIDPHRPILSSAHVPPQRRDWWAEEVRNDGGLDILPAEIFDLTVGLVDDFPLSWEQAVEHRAKLMEERSVFVDHQTETMFEETFSFCEH